MTVLPLISIIVPVYGVEEYLDRCVKSVVDQTYHNLEIILVDDGSPDNCPVMCDNWTEKDSRIKVIHKQNGGLSDARNVGMAGSTGEFIFFLDSDDTIAPQAIQLLFDSLMDTESEISVCGMEMVWDDGTPGRMLTRKGSCVLNREMAMEAIIRETWLKQPACGKLYKAELIREIPFPVGKCHEDVFWSYQAVGRARKVSVFDTPCYFYLQRGGSIMGSGYSPKRLDALEARTERMGYLEMEFPALVEEGKRELWFFCMYLLQMAMKNLDGEALMSTKNRVRKAIKEVRPVSAGNISLKQRLWLNLSQVSFEGTCRLRNMLGIGL